MICSLESAVHSNFVRSQVGAGLKRDTAQSKRAGDFELTETIRYPRFGYRKVIVK